MVRVSRQTVALLDASKFGQRSLSVIAPMKALDMVISDASAPAEYVEALEALGVQLRLV